MSDAMTSNRPYRSAMTVGQAQAELRANSETQFDSACVEALLRWIQSWNSFRQHSESGMRSVDCGMGRSQHHTPMTHHP